MARAGRLTWPVPHSHHHQARLVRRPLVLRLRQHLLDLPGRLPAPAGTSATSASPTTSYSSSSSAIRPNPGKVFDLELPLEQPPRATPRCVSAGPSRRCCVPDQPRLHPRSTRGTTHPPRDRQRPRALVHRRRLRHPHLQRHRAVTHVRRPRPVHPPAPTAAGTATPSARPSTSPRASDWSAPATARCCAYAPVTPSYVRLTRSTGTARPPTPS